MFSGILIVFLKVSSIEIELNLKDVNFEWKSIKLNLKVR